MREWSPEFKANLERALENLFDFSPESMERIAPFREALEKQRRALEEEKRNAAIQVKHEDLSLILETKFGPLSQELVSRIKAIRNVDELTRLCKQAIQAQTLDEVDI